MKIGVLGAGIAGLSLAYYLRKKWPDCEITLVDQAEHAGGVISSINEGDFFFSQGPSIFYTKRSFPLIQLIKDLGLTSEVISYAPEILQRYIWLDESLQPLSFNPFRIFTSSVTKALYKALLHEWNYPRNEGDESVFAFAKRRLGKEGAEKLVDSLMPSVHGGSTRQLSSWVTLKFFKELERDYGSITRGMRLCHRKQEYCPITEIEQSDLFTLKQGMHAVVETLLQNARCKQEFGKNVLAIMPNGNVVTDQGQMQFDRIFSTLPLPALASAIDHPEMVTFCKENPMVNLVEVHVGFSQKVLKKKGFGYWACPLEGEDCLGALFDSNIFPQQNNGEQTRITFSFGGAHRPEFLNMPDEEILTRVYNCLDMHLEIQVQPDFTKIMRYPHAQITYSVGFNEKLQRLQSSLKESYPQLTIAGSVREAFSTSDLIELSAKIVLDA